MKRNYILIILGWLWLSSCTKEYSEEFVPYSNNPLNTDTVWRQPPSTGLASNTIIAQELLLTPMVDSFDVNTGAIINFPDNLTISFPPNCCVGNYASSPGKIKVEVIWLKKKGDFIRHAKPTTSYNYLLQTGGSFNVLLSKNNIPLQLAPGVSYKLKYRNFSPSADMRFFYEESWTVGNDSAATWVPGYLPPNANVGTVNIWQQYDSSTQTIIKGYEMTSSRLRWVNCDFFNDTTQPFTRLNVSLPVNYTNVNTSVYVVFKSKNIVATLKSDLATKTFFLPRIPIGSDVTLVSISKIGNDYYLGKKDLTVLNANLNNISPELKSLTEISNYLNSL
jgi:hypothetical protein